MGGVYPALTQVNLSLSANVLFCGGSKENLNPFGPCTSMDPPSSGAAEMVPATTPVVSFRIVQISATSLYVALQAAGDGDTADVTDEPS